MRPVQSYIKKIIDQVINWAVPVICAAALVFWKKIPAEAQHYWPVICVSIVGLYSMLIAVQNRKEIKRIQRERADAAKREAETREKDENIAKAFRAMLDDDMGNLYAACVARGYTTEDERRRYDRLQKAYESVGGNGEAKRRKIHFEAIPFKEEWQHDGHSGDEYRKD